MKKLFLALALVPLGASAAHLITDPLVGSPTHCGISLDAAVDIVVTVTPAASIPAPNTPPVGSIVCYYDISTLVTGLHTAKVDAQIIDPTGVFPTVISAYTSVVSFTVPGIPGPPLNLRVIK